mmetsp:Transcript_10644/g.20613  ORF Transcript_10644/g.20613 Transcript_10644/m.20613 type:complete len:249 (+) Transcript_10644:4963-5709(+)
MRRVDFEVLNSITALTSIYEGSMKKDSCLSVCVEDLCGGWTTVTYFQVLTKMTKQGRICLPLVFYNSTELAVISNKRSCLEEVFKLFDTRALSRVDAMEMLSVFCLITSGSLDEKLNNAFFIFGYTDPMCLTKDEFIYFLDSLARGICKVCLTTNDTFYPRRPNKRLSMKELTRIADLIFENTATLSVEDFVARMYRKCPELNKFISLFSLNFQSAAEKARELMVSRMPLETMIKRLLIQELLPRVVR